MNKIARLGIGGLMILSAQGIFSQQINPMREAVIRTYTEALQENPKDYYTLYDRASQYYSIGDWDKALSDIDKALEYTPAKQTDYKAMEYSLKSDILSAMNDNEGAIEALKAGLKVKPGSQSDMYKLGNLYLSSQQPQEALKVFQQLQRENPRSQDAYYGMAKANISLGKYDEVDQLLTQIESVGIQNYLTYCRLGDIYSDMGNISKATNNYVAACALAEKSSRPIESLKLLSRKYPKETIEAINGMLASSPENSGLNYIKAILAYDLGMYDISEKAGQDIVARVEESPTVYRMIAMSELMQNKTDEAKENIKKAEGLDVSNPSLMIDKANIYMISEPTVAYESAKQALAQLPDNPEALYVGAKTAILAGQYEDALNYLNHLVLSNPSDGSALLLRGCLNTEYLKDEKSGVSDYSRAGNIPQDGSVGNMVIAALGKSRSGKKLDAESLINEAVEKAGTDKDDLYLIAVYYAQTGNLEKAKEYADKALANGYSNLFNLTGNNEPVFNLVPIHHLLGKK